MPIQLMSNYNYPIGNIIQKELQSAKYAKFAVAFLKHSGIKVIEESLLQCLENGGDVELIVGLDFKMTDPKSIDYFLKLKKEHAKANLFCFGDKTPKAPNKTDVVFHPKIYLFEKGREKTGIVGSTNLTKGGLTSNIEVNTIFKETRPVYFSQLQAIYNSVKYTDSVFAPDEEYLAKYSDVFQAFSDNEDKARNDKGVQRVIKEIQDKEKALPGPRTLKSLIIDAIKVLRRKGGRQYIVLSEIYEEVEKFVTKNENLGFKKETLRNSIRGEINHNEQETNSRKGGRNLRLFLRSKEKQGFYALTEEGESYQGR